MVASTTFIESTGTIDPTITNGYFPPIALNGLVGFWDLGGTPGSGETSTDVLNRSKINLVNPALVPSVIGAPAVASDGITFTQGTNYFDTLLPETSDFTFIALAKWSAQTIHHLFGNYGSPSNAYGTTLFNGGYTAPTGNLKAGYGTLVSGTPTFASNGTNNDTDWASWSLALGMGQAAVGLTAKDLIGTASRFDANANARAMGTGTLRLGGAYSTTGNGGASKIKYVMVYNRTISTAEMATITAFVRTAAAAAGLTLPA